MPALKSRKPPTLVGGSSLSLGGIMDKLKMFGNKIVEISLFPVFAGTAVASYAVGIFCATVEEYFSRGEIFQDFFD